MPESVAQTDSQATVSVHADYLPFINFAMQTNAVPWVRSVTIANHTDDPLRNLQVRISCDPPIFAEKVARIDQIEPRTTFSIKDVNLILLREPLRARIEREEGQLWVEVEVDGVVRCRTPFPLAVLAFNEWCGGSSIRELIAAHVLPNDPAVERVLAEAGGVLRESAQDPSLTAYQSGDPRRAYTEAAAIYWAAARQG